MNYEEQVKKQLFDLWKKDAVRVEKHNGGWERRRVSLGNGTALLKGTVSVPKMLAIIEEFGVPAEEIKRMDMSYDEINELYDAIRAYRMSMKFLKEFKTNLDRRRLG